MNDPERSLSDEATFAGAAKRRAASEMSLGDERTLGDRLGDQDTVIDDIEVVDLEARYRVEGTLGQGGMGAVLLATDTRLDRKVAIKRILGEAAGNRMAVQRFLTEAKSIAALNHQNIVQIYDYGRAKDGPFLIMEYVDGGSLLDRCRESALPLDEAIDLACHLCDGLAKAHDLGIVHRDIKPANVLLTKDGIPKLTDFGLAKAQASDYGQTMTGAVLGTPDFMPPEQRRDASLVDHRSDLWSLAATVYQMVTGRSPKIIRFDLLPAELTKVLGKALEDAKDDRYQAAREFRDALKVSLRVAAPVAAPVAAEVGQCPACGVSNDISRKFCRGCGGSLEAFCLSCSKPMPMWEEICGSCGTKQTPLLESRRVAMAEEQAKAEGLLGDFAFDEAARIATRLRDEPDSRLDRLKPWAERFLREVEASKIHQVERAIESLAEAAKHETASDYMSAIFSLESIPEAMRSAVLPGARESVAAVLGRLKSRQAESVRLETLVKERIASKSLDGLLPDVERLLAIRADRRDVKKLRQQLLERQERQETARNEAVATARALMARRDYDGAAAALANVAAVVTTSEVGELRREAESKAAKTKTLAAEIRSAVAGKRLDGLLGMVNSYLELKPDDSDIGKLRQSLLSREEKFAAEIGARVGKATKLECSCRFSEAVKVLESIPEDRRGDNVDEIILRCMEGAALRKAALRTVQGATAGGYGEAIEQVGGYRQFLRAASLEDKEFSAALGIAETAHAEEQQRRRLLRTCSIVAAGVAAVAILVGIGFGIRSSQRASALAAALRTARWQDALAIDPHNIQALLGRSAAKLSDLPPDINGAFLDIELAERVSPGRADVGVALGSAHAARAVEHVRGGRVAKAATDLAKAVELCAEPQAIEAAVKMIAEPCRGLMLQEYRKQFDSFVVMDRWNEAATLAATAVRLDPLLARWFGSQITATHLSTMPPQMISKLPTSVIAHLQTDAIATLPIKAITNRPPIRNSIGIELKLIPPGKVTIKDEVNNTHSHQVTLSQPFYIGVYEVTNAQWKRVMNNVPSDWKEDNLPVELVGWHDAVEFCKTLSEFPDEQSAGRVYRLPTEEEWEYACRAGKETTYSFGVDERLLPRYCWFEGNSGRQPHPVGATKPNNWGLYDMHGNVWEMCSNITPVAIRIGISSTNGSNRPREAGVIRGGSWHDHASNCTSTSRRGVHRDATVGFRLALSPPETEPAETGTGGKRSNTRDSYLEVNDRDRPKPAVATKQPPTPPPQASPAPAKPTPAAEPAKPADLAAADGEEEEEVEEIVVMVDENGEIVSEEEMAEGDVETVEEVVEEDGKAPTTK